MKNVCGVEGIHPESQVVHSIGSKAALSILPNCFINPGDVALMTTLGYPASARTRSTSAARYTCRCWRRTTSSRTWGAFPPTS